MLTQDKVREIQKDLSEALNIVAKKHGLVAGGANIRFDATTFTLKTQFGVATKVQAGSDPKWVANTSRFGGFYNLGTDMLGKSYTDPVYGTCTYVGMTSRDKAVVKVANRASKNFMRIDAERLQQLLIAESVKR